MTYPRIDVLSYRHSELSCKWALTYKIYIKFSIHYCDNVMFYQKNHSQISSTRTVTSRDRYTLGVCLKDAIRNMAVRNPNVGRSFQQGEARKLKLFSPSIVFFLTTVLELPFRSVAVKIFYVLESSRQYCRQARV